MRYEEYYYKNLCEKYQRRIDILEKFLSEAGFKKAMKTGNPNLLAKEAMKAGERRERYLNRAAEASENALQSQRRYGGFSAQAGRLGLEAETKRDQASRLLQNIEDIDIQLSSEDPELRKVSSKKYIKQSTLGPDVFPERPFMTPSTSGSYQY